MMNVVFSYFDIMLIIGANFVAICVHKLKCKQTKIQSQKDLKDNTNIRENEEK